MTSIMTGPSGNKFQDLCTMVGLMTITWAWAENALAMTVGVINENAGPITGHPEAPLSLKKRISCLKVALRDIKALHPLQEDGRALAMRFVKLGVRRHNFVHGAAWQHHEGGFESMGLAIKAGNYAVQNQRFDIGDAVSLNAEIAKLSDDATAFMLRVGKIFAG
jgi:hypothetical protein